MEDGLRDIIGSYENGISRLNPCCCGRWSQRSLSANQWNSRYHVLILVVVEDGLRGSIVEGSVKKFTAVLILVVVEDGLRAHQWHCKYHQMRLNPCCCGRWSQRGRNKWWLVIADICSLNPCCCGRWSQRCQKVFLQVLHGKCLNPCCCGRWSQSISVFRNNQTI